MEQKKIQGDYFQKFMSECFAAATFVSFSNSRLCYTGIISMVHLLDICWTGQNAGLIKRIGKLVGIMVVACTNRSLQK